jgi:allantoinase
MKIPKHYFGNIWMAKSGFGGTEYLLPALVSEGTRRGMGYNHMARVTSWNPAQRYGLNRKGDIAPGFDADLALVDPAQDLDHRRQGFTVDAGLHALRRAGAVGARGRDLPARHLIYQGGEVIGKPRGAVPAPPDGMTRRPFAPGRTVGGEHR